MNERKPVPIELTEYPNAADMSVNYVVKVNSLAMMDEYAVTAIYKLICDRVAEKYVEEHYIEIAAKLDQNAIANLAIAEASKKIAEEIQRKPNIVHEVETQIFERGIFGRTRRVG
jgi:hypothetical protein